MTNSPANDRHAETPIIFLTGKKFEVNTAEITDELHVSAFISKPFSPIALIETIESTILASTAI